MNEQYEDHISFLRLKLGQAETDAPGIDWESFERHRRRKRVIPWLWKISWIVVFILTGIYVQYQLNSNSVEIQGRNGQLTGISQNSKVKKEQSVTESGNKLSYVPGSANSSGYQKVLTKQSVISYTGNSQTNIKVRSGYGQNGLEWVIPNHGDLVSSTIRVLWARPVPWNKLKIDNMIKPTEDIQTAKPGTYLQFSAGSGLTLNGLQITQFGKSYIHKEYEKIRKNSEAGYSSWSVTANFLHRTKHFIFSAGLGVTGFSVRGDYNYKITEKPVLNAEGKIVNYLNGPLVEMKFQSMHKTVFTELPVSAQWVFQSGRKYHVAFLLGHTLQFLNRVSGQLPDAQFLENKTNLGNENFKGASQSVSFGIPVYVDVNRNRGFSIVPMYRYHMGMSQAQGLFKTKFSQFTVQCSYIHRF